MIRELKPAIVFVAALLGLGAATFSELRTLATTDTAERPQLVGAYRVDEAHSTTFPLPGGDRVLRLVTNALGEPDATGEIAYALDVELRSPAGDVLLTRRIALTSRRSLLDPADPDSAPAFDGKGTPIADPRRFDLPLPEVTEPGAVLVIRSAGAPLLLRAWTARALTDTERAIRQLGQLGEDLDVDVLPDAERLRDVEREALASWRYVRLAAAGRPGVDHAVQAFQVRAIPERVVTTLTPTIDASHGLSVLVQGPAKVRVLGAGLGTTVHATVTLGGASIQQVGAADVSSTDEAVLWEGVVPGGVHSVELRADGPLRARVEGPASAAVPPGPSDDLAELASNEQWLEVAAAGADPAVLELAGARRVELEVWTASPGPVALTVSSGGQSRGIEVVTSRDSLAALMLTGQPPAPAATATTVRLTVPPGAQYLDVRSDPPAWVRFRVPLDDGAMGAPTPPEPVRVRGVAVDEPRWTTVPAASATTTAQLLRFARVEPTEPPPPPTVGLSCRVVPAAAPERLTVLEPVGADSLVPRRTELPTDRPLRLRLDVPRSRARVRYEVEDLDRLGAEVPVMLDGAQVGVITAALSRGTLPLPPLAAGAHTLAASAPPGMRLLTDLQTAPGETATSWAARTVYQLSAGGLRVAVPISADGPRGLDVIAYHPSAGAPRATLRASIDGGTPRLIPLGIYETRTPSSVTRGLGPASGEGAAMRVDGVREPIGTARTVVVPFGDDLAPGVHWVEVHASEPLWVRFFVMSTDAVCPPLPEDEE